MSIDEEVKRMLSQTKEIITSQGMEDVFIPTPKADDMKVLDGIEYRVQAIRYDSIMKALYFVIDDEVRCEDNDTITPVDVALGCGCVVNVVTEMMESIYKLRMETNLN